MAYFIPTSYQKRLLHYALSHFGIIDTDTLNLQQLDITWGQRSSIELRDVGLHIKKIAHLLHIPDSVQPTKARILLLRLTVPADIYRSGIVVEVNGIEIKARLAEENGQTGGKKSNKSGPDQETTHEDEHLPTAQELAQSFVADKAPEEREELKAALEAEGAPHFDDDAQSETSDDESAVGMGTNLSLPGWIANFLKGIVDRLEMSITNVTLALDADLLIDEAVPSSLTTVSTELVIRSVGIEGLTTAPKTSDTKEKAAPSSVNAGLERPNKRRIRLQDISGFFVSEAALFASLERPFNPASPVSTRADSSVHQSSENGSVAGQSSPRSTRSAQESQKDLISDSVRSIRPTRRRDQDGCTSPSLDGLTRTIERSEHDLTLSVLSEDRYADASDDGHEEDEEEREEENDSRASMSSFRLRNVRSPAYQDSYASDQDDEEFPFSMDDSQHSEAQSVDEQRQFASPSASMHEQRQFASPSASMILDHVQFDPRDYTQHQAMSPPERPHFTDLAATAPLARLHPQFTSNLPRPYDSQPLPALKQSINTRDQLEIPLRKPPQDVSSPAGSISSGGSSDSQSRSGDDDLSESRIFSHEEAESMYLSAMSDLGPRNMPGGWGRDSNSSRDSDSAQVSDAASVIHAPPSDTDEKEGTGFETPRPSSPISPFIGESTSQTASPAPEHVHLSSSIPSSEQEPGTSHAPTTSRCLLNIDEISLWLPWAGGEKEVAADPVVPAKPAPVDHLAYGEMPGAFSMYASMRGAGTRRSSSPRPRFAPSVTIEDSMATLPDQSQLLPREKTPDLELEIGTVRSQVDFTTSRVLFQVVQQFLGAWAGQPVPPMKQEMRPVEAIESAEMSQILSVKVKELSLSFLERMPAFVAVSSPNLTGSTTQHDTLFQIRIAGVDVSAQLNQSLKQADLAIKAFEFGTPDETIIAFDNPSRKPTSMRAQNRKIKNDISINYTTVERSRGPEIRVKMLPLLMSLNMHKLDDRLAGFGGVSGVLDMSSSIASNSTILAAPPAPKLGGKAVHFGAPPGGATEDVLTPIKVTARIEGMTFDLQGKACGVLLQSNRLKLAVRKDHAVVAIDQIRIMGPFYTHQDIQPGLLVNVANTSLTFLLKPEEEDLTTLVSLITPSRDRYEDDDDILLDTLLRQREKGSLIRLNIGDVKISVDDLDNTKRLQLLSYEIGKLSSVAKYLPEDDRPGLLTLASVDRIEAHAVINESIGSVAATFHQFRIAHVGLPSLLALELSALEVTRNAEDDLVGPLLQLQSDDRLPMIMARIIGDELEPTIKVKLFNLVAEYRVPTLMAILGIAGAETVEDLAANMASSVATIRLDSSQGISRQDSGATSLSNRSSVSPFHVDLLLRDCAIGLNPEKSPSKGLFLLTNARFKANTSVKESFSASLELRKTSILLIDDTQNWDASIKPALRPRSSQIASPALSDFCRQGWQSVATISVAELAVHIADDGKGESLVNVTLSNKLFFMESCADSTQTLISVLNGLSPPQPPSKAERYRTSNSNSVPIQDMMASFSGEAFSQSRSVENVDDDLDIDADHVLDDLPSNLDFVGSFYNPEPDYEYDYGEQSDFPIGGASQVGAGSQASIRSTASPRTNVSKAASFAEGIEENFEYGPSNTRLDVKEDYLTFFKAKSAVRKWNQTATKFENIYEPEIKNCPVRVHVSIESIIWHLYDGYDWSRTRDVISRAVEDVEARAEERRRNRQTSLPEDDTESEIGDLLFQSIWIAIPPNREDVDLRKQINHGMDDGASETMTVTTSANSRDTSRPTHKRRKSRTLMLERSKTHRITFEMQRVLADFIVLGPGFDETHSSMALRVDDFKIFDHIPTSTWKTFLTYNSDAGERQKDLSMLRLEVLFVKPLQELSTSELLIKVNMLPLLLHVDQDALDFVTRFFEFKNEEDVDKEFEKPNEQPFIQRIEVNSIPVNLHYKPKRVNYSGLRSGHASEFANFVVLEGAQFTLKHLILYGVNADDLQKSLKGLWTDEVIENQIPTVIAGLAAVKPFVDVGSGVRDLVMVPVREYRRDGRIVRSIQKGATAFARTTTTNLARLGARVAIGTQTALEGAEALLSPTTASARPTGPRRRSGDDWEDNDDFSTSPPREERKAISNYADQPLNVMTGFRDAWRSLERDLTTTRDAIIAIGGDVRDSSSAMGVAGAVARRAPTIILRPAIGGTKAMGIALLGGVNTLDKGSRKRIEDKYK